MPTFKGYRTVELKNVAFIDALTEDEAKEIAEESDIDDAIWSTTEILSDEVFVIGKTN